MVTDRQWLWCALSSHWHTRHPRPDISSRRSVEQLRGSIGQCIALVLLLSSREWPWSNRAALPFQSFSHSQFRYHTTGLFQSEWNNRLFWDQSAVLKGKSYLEKMKNRFSDKQALIRRWEEKFSWNTAVERTNTTFKEDISSQLISINV